MTADRSPADVAREIARNTYPQTEHETRQWLEAAITAALLAERERALRDASEPVAWRLRVGGQNLWSYTETEADADFYINQSGVSTFEKEPLYAGATLRAERARVWEEAVELCDDIADQAQTDGQELGALRCRDACHIHVKQEKAGG